MDTLQLIGMTIFISGMLIMAIRVWDDYKQWKIDKKDKIRHENLLADKTNGIFVNNIKIGKVFSILNLYSIIKVDCFIFDEQYNCFKLLGINVDVVCDGEKYTGKITGVSINGGFISNIEVNIKEKELCL